MKKNHHRFWCVYEKWGSESSAGEKEFDNNKKENVQ